VKLANMDGLIWAIIFVVVALVKGFTKLQKPAADDSADEDETPPVMAPGPARPQPRPQPRPRPVVLAAQRLPPPISRTAAPMGPRPVAAAAGKARTIDADQIRRFIEQLSGQSMPQPPAVPPPVPSPAPPPPPPQPESVPDVPDTQQTIAKAPASTQSTRASQWAQALRDRQNVRNIVISAEIIGPPRGESA
jgi:hypothetical protein